MTITHIEQESSGARVVFSNGSPYLRQACPPPPGAAAAFASMISPGTELRHMSGSTARSDLSAGSMNIAYWPVSGEVMLAPAPHGAWMRLDHSRALAATADTALSVVAAARFQLIAAVGMSHTAFSAPSAAVVVGSGPVALGCCLELLRRGTTDLTLLTDRAEVPFTRDLGIRVTRSVTAGCAFVVIDATGRVEKGLSAVAPGGTLGLLGTPDSESAVSAARLLRQGLAVIGMQELSGYDHAICQHQYSAVLAWLTATYGSAVPARWCVRVRENHVLDHYRHLAAGGTGRNTRPITILEWGQ